MNAQSQTPQLIFVVKIFLWCKGLFLRNLLSGGRDLIGRVISRNLLIEQDTRRVQRVIKITVITCVILRLLTSKGLSF